MKVVIYGLTITSSWGNGHATTFRSLCKALHARGHSIHFVEKDVEWYCSHRDMHRPPYCAVQLYDSWAAEEPALLAAALDADVVVIGSYFPDAIVATRALCSHVRCPILFYDIDTPITMAGLRRSSATDYLRAELIPAYAAYLSFTAGPVLKELEDNFGAQRALPLFCSVDPDIYRRVPAQPRFQSDLSYLGTYAVDRQAKLTTLLDGAAAILPQQHFLVAGPQYPEGITWQANVVHLEHVPPADHPAFYSSSRFTLNLTREEMVKAGYSPSVRLFEASACASTIISDPWAGLSDLLTPGEEILLPADAYEVARLLKDLPDEQRRRIGQRARERILAEHTAEHRAREFEQIVSQCASPALR